MKKLLCMLLCLFMMFNGNIIVQAEQVSDERNYAEEAFVNPFFREQTTEQDLLDNLHRLMDSIEIGDPDTICVTSPKTYTTYAEAVAFLKEQLMKRESNIVISVATSVAENYDVNTFGTTVIQSAEEHTGKPREGDYIRWNMYGWSWRATWNSSTYTITYNITHLDTLAQEAKVDTAVASLLKELNLSKASNLDKILGVSAYITENIVYDYDNLEDDSYIIKHATYSAIIDHKTVCQGYSTLFYRLMLELGVDARVIVSIDSENHAWNIVKLGNYYYNMDLTWDSPNYYYGCYDWLLLSPTDFTQHTRDAEYTTSAFNTKYPMASSSYNLGLYIIKQPEDVFAYDGETATFWYRMAGRECWGLWQMYDTSSSQWVYLQDSNGNYCDNQGISFTASEDWDGAKFRVEIRSDDGSQIKYTREATFRLDKGYIFNKWVWSSDNSTCKAVFRNDARNLNKEVTATVKKQTTKATCDTDGKTVYTATVSFEGKTYTDTKTVKIPKLGHDYRITAWNWDIDKIKASATFVCRNDESHNATVEAEVYIQMKDLIRHWIATVVFNGETYTASRTAVAKKVTRIYGDNRYETSLLAADYLKSLMGVDKFESVVLTTGKDYADALSGSYLANSLHAPVILIAPNTKTKFYADNAIEYINENLQRGGVVYVLGGEGAIPEELLENLGDFMICRIADENRYLTNIRVLQEVGYYQGKILVCTGKDFADSLSSSAVDLPILLVNGTRLTNAQKEFLSTVINPEFYIIGGEGAVSSNVETQLASYGTVVKRIAGENRYETSVKIAQEFFENPEYAVLAYGKNYPDGLSAGSIAYYKKAPLILMMSSNKNSQPARDYVVGKSILNGAVMGGPTLLTDEFVKPVFGLTSADQITIVH